MTKGNSARNEFPRPLEEGEEALAPHLVEKAYPTGWKVPRLNMYNGTTNPEDHIHSFRTEMEDMTDWKDIWCHMF